MIVRIATKKNCYQDSVKLMQITNHIKAMPGIITAAAFMGTDNNKATMSRAGFDLAQMDQAGPNDILFLVKGEDEASVEAAIVRYQFALDEQDTGSETGAPAPRSVSSAGSMLPGANLALISVPGEYASYEAFKALRAGMNVHLFSDNVPIEQEIRLKKLGQRLGLLVMGPDCGTSIIGGVPLGFANVVASGPVGIVGASGTGIQQLSVLIDRLGSGVSHAIGVGGRDLTDAVGGISTSMALDVLEDDDQTKVIVLISKPPGTQTRKRIIEKVKASSKPVVVIFFGGDKSFVDGQEYAAANLEQGAAMAVALAAGKEPGSDIISFPRDGVGDIVVKETGGKAASRKYLRGLFSGGSLAAEALLELNEYISPVTSNIHPDPALKTADVDKSSGHTVIDMGDDYFTQGRPHPMIDPYYRAERLLAEWADPEVAVILCDVVLGHGCHPNPAGALAEAVKEARSQYGEGVTVVASVCGTEKDPQILSVQEALLKEAGVLVFPTNVFAAQVAGEITRISFERSDAGDKKAY